MSEVKLPEISKARGASRGAPMGRSGMTPNDGMVKRQNSVGSAGGPMKSKFVAKKER